jgi:hypothetical protein
LVRNTTLLLLRKAAAGTRKNAWDSIRPADDVGSERITSASKRGSRPKSAGALVQAAWLVRLGGQAKLKHRRVIGVENLLAAL